MLGRTGDDVSRAPLGVSGLLLPPLWGMGGLFQRQVAKESQSLKVTAEEPPGRGAPGSPAVISYVTVPFCHMAW